MKSFVELPVMKMFLNPKGKVFLPFWWIPQMSVNELGWDVDGAGKKIL